MFYTIDLSELPKTEAEKIQSEIKELSKEHTAESIASILKDKGIDVNKIK